MDDIENLSLKPCVVLIEKWIASNEIGEDGDSGNVCHVVNDDRVSNINCVNGRSSLPETPEKIDDDDKAASLLLAIKNRKSNKKKCRHGHDPMSCLQSRISSYLKDDLFSDRHADIVGLENDVDREQGSIKNSSENVSPSGNVDEHKHEELDASASPPNLFELCHAMYEEVVDDIPASDFPVPNDETGYVRSISVDTNNQENDLGSEDFHGDIPGAQADSHINYGDEVDYMEQNDHRQNLKHAEFCEDDVRDTFQPSHEFDDDDDSNQPIDYSIHHGQYDTPTDLSANRNNSTVHPTELRSFVSPAATLRTGFVRNEQRDSRFLSFPARNHFDDQRKTNRKSLHFPVAQNLGQSLEVPTISQYYDTFGTEVAHEQFPVEIEDLSAATDGIAGHTSTGTPVETANASSQTEIEGKVAITLDEKFCRMFMENSNFNLTMFMQSFYAVAQLAFSTINPSLTSHCGSASSGESSGHATSHSENSSIQRLDESRPNDDVSSDPKSMQTQNIPAGRRKKTFKKKGGIPLKRSERIFELEARKVKESQDAKQTEVVPPKKSKRDVNQKFDVETVSGSGNQMSDDFLHAAPRKIRFSIDAFRISNESVHVQTPKRPSKYFTSKRFH